MNIIKCKNKINYLFAGMKEIPKIVNIIKKEKKYVELFLFRIV